MAEYLTVNGWLVAETETHPAAPSGRSYGGRLFLFRSPDGWALLHVQHGSQWSQDGRPLEGRASALIKTFPDLGALRSHLHYHSYSREWRQLVEAGWVADAELRALWTPVQIDMDLDRSSIYHRELAEQGPGRDLKGWRGIALEEALARLQDMGFVVLKSSSDVLDIFGSPLEWPWNRRLGAAAVTKYGYRADVVVAIDPCGEIYTRTPDGTFEPGESRRYPPRPLTAGEAEQARQIYERRRADQQHELAEGDDA